MPFGVNLKKETSLAGVSLFSVCRSPAKISQKDLTNLKNVL